MKKFFLLLLNVTIFSLLAISCSNDEPSVNTPKNSSLDDLYNKRTKEEVLNIAKNYANAINSNKSRSNVLQIDYPSLTPVLNIKSRQSSDTLIYAVDFMDDNGYLLISANKLTEPILAIIDSGKYSDAEDSYDTGYEDFLEAAHNYVSNTITSPTGGFIPNPDPIMMTYYNDTVKLYNAAIERLDVKWGQGWPENIYCPNNVAGCVPVATAQVLSYFKPEMNLALTFDGRPKDYVNINWESICKHKKSLSSKNPTSSTINSHFSDCNAGEEAHDMLALLVRQIGQRINANYSNPTQTSAYTWNAISYVKTILSDHTYTDVQGFYYHDYIVDGGIALVSCRTENNEGHAWVIDGKFSIEYVITTYYNYYPSTGIYESKTTKKETAKYVHCNWGWDGVKNGYFLDGIYDTETGITAPSISELHLSRYNFNTNMYGTVFK